MNELSAIFSTLRKTFPHLIAQDIIGVQPMTGPVGSIFTLRTRYDKYWGDGDEVKTFGTCLSPDGLFEYWYYSEKHRRHEDMVKWCAETLGADQLDKTWFSGAEGFGDYLFLFEREQDFIVFLLAWGEYHSG